MYRCTIVLTLSVILMISCSTEKDYGRALLNADNIEDAAIYATKLEKFGKNAIPVFIKDLKLLMDNQYSVNDYGKIHICLNSLSNLAQKGIYSKDEVNALLQILEKQVYLEDTIITAKLIKLITGIDIGYNESFIRNYTPDKEDERIHLIHQWRKAIESRQ